MQADDIQFRLAAARRVLACDSPARLSDLEIILQELVRDPKHRHRGPDDLVRLAVQQNRWRRITEYNHRNKPPNRKRLAGRQVQLRKLPERCYRDPECIDFRVLDLVCWSVLPERMRFTIARLADGDTQAEVARLLGVSQTLVSEWVRTRIRPSLAHLDPEGSPR